MKNERAREMGAASGSVRVGRSDVSALRVGRSRPNIGASASWVVNLTVCKPKHRAGGRAAIDRSVGTDSGEANWVRTSEGKEMSRNRAREHYCRSKGAGFGAYEQEG